LGNPGLVLPAGCSREGLPIGIQVVGQPNAEELILKVGLAIQEALGPTRQAPMMLEGHR